MSLIQALQNPELFDHPITQFDVVETHISWVLLTGPYAYKIKKPVNFGFLDFSTLEKRKHYCQEELRLNRRLAPQLYIDVVRLCGTAQHPQLNGTGPAFEYAVKMHQFAQHNQLDRMLAKHGLEPRYIDELAKTVAAFHLSIDVVAAGSAYGDASHVAQPILENFTQIRQCMQDKNVMKRLDRLQRWSKEQLQKLDTVLQERKTRGFIRECHGDMHLRNIALIDDKIVIFDCIEFNKNFYMIDVMSEIAFLVMDLEDRQQAALARRFLNLYLEITGDYAGLQVLGFYKVYRAMVRAKVDALRASQEQPGSKEHTETYQDFLQYLQLAEQYTQPTSPCLLINHGLSGSGKSYATKMLLEKIPVIVLRSDIERKRLYDIDIQQHLPGAIEHGIYSQQASTRTYSHLAMLAKLLIHAGYIVVIDAANLKRSQRQLFAELAHSMHCPYAILDYQASHETLRQRISRRMLLEQDASDATLAVLKHQITNHEPIAADERPVTITIESEQEIDIDDIVSRLAQFISL